MLKLNIRVISINILKEYYNNTLNWVIYIITKKKTKKYNAKKTKVKKKLKRNNNIM